MTEKLTYEEMEKRYELYRRVLQHILAEKTGHYFICGESGDKDSIGLPERIIVCPTYGSDLVQIYAKLGKTSGPEW